MSNFGYVKDYNLQFSGALTPRKKTARILLHHTEGGAAETVPGIHAFHLSKGHKGIDYNICVERDGTVVWGRGLEYCGGSVNNSVAGTKGMNDDSIAIAALGNFEINQMPDVQKEALKRIVRDVALHYGIMEIKGHNEVAGRGYTTCPGKFFPLDEVRAYAVGGNTSPGPSADVPELTRILKRGCKGEDVRMLQERLHYHKANAGKADGVFGSQTEEAVKAFQAARINEGRDVGCRYNGNKPDGKVGDNTWGILWEGDR